MSSVSNKRLIDAILSYCIEKGYSIIATDKIESERFNKRDIKESGLDIKDAIRCLSDIKRTECFLDEIKNIVHKNDLVLEAGFGTGILAFMASETGAKVTAIELNTETYDFAIRLFDYLKQNNILFNQQPDFINENAIRYTPAVKPDVIISENIYTGGFYEKQVQIMNNLVKYLKSDGKVIPKGLRSGVNVITAKFSHVPYQYEIFVPLENEVNYFELSSSLVYSELDFSVENNVNIDWEGTFGINKGGVINALLVWSEVLLYDDKVISREDTNYLNNDIVISLNEEYVVKAGDTIKVSIQYEYGSLPKDISIQLKQIR